jgi:hypothetical protein
MSTDFNGPIPADYGDELALLTCWRKGQKVGEVTVGEVIPDKTILKQTVSHYRWGSVGEVTAKNEVVLKRVDGQHLRFKMDDCKRVE